MSNADAAAANAPSVAPEEPMKEPPSSPLMAPTAEGLVLDFEPKFETMQARNAQFKLEWENLTYSVGGSNPKYKKTLLKGICGEANPGEVVAIMGPSGAGKTTLLNVLAGRISGGHGGKTLSGDIKANGVVVSAAQFRKRVAYVTQEDALFPTATAREALEFSARLRLPRSRSEADRKRLVEDMIESLGLTKCQNTYIGSDLIRGLSGGEKKRVAIGVELVSSPSVLFADECTSGLDSYSAWKVIRILKCLASKGCTVLCSIHQPSSEVFNEFTSLIFLGQGEVVYQGNIGDVDEPFREKGLGVPPRTNIADHIMLLIQTRPLDTLPRDNDNKRRYSKVLVKDGAVDIEKGDAIKKATAGKSFFGSLKTLGRAGSSIFRSPDDENLGANWWVQSAWLARREFLGTFRDKAGLIGRFGGTAFLNVLFAILFLYIGDQNRSTYTTQSHFGGLVQIFIGALFGAAQPAILTFPLERVVFLREKSTNTYATVPYVFSKLLVELPLSFLTAILTFLISYWTMSLDGNFILLVLPLWGLMLAATSTAYILGSVASNARAALELAPIVLVPQILFLGFFVQLNQMPVWISWAQYLVATKYALNIAMLVEFPIDLAQPQNKQAWIDLLKFNDVTSDMAWFYALMLFVIFAGFRLISLVLLNERAKRFET